MGNHWNAKLIRAARRRATVVLWNGKRGVIVYAPKRGLTDPTPKHPRHGDPTKCGVRLHDKNRDWIASVDPKDIIAIEDP
jgi:hypothetical protein